MLASTPLWLTARPYPLLPIAPWFPIAPPPFDRILFACALLSCGLGLYRPGLIAFLIISLYLALSDQARWQPWFYMYWIMLLLTLPSERRISRSGELPRALPLLSVPLGLCGEITASRLRLRTPSSTALTACRAAITAVYLWGGIQKCNSAYFDIVVPFLSRPMAALPFLRGALAAGPAIEIFIALALWFPSTRRLALALAAVLHATALLLLGPLGHAHNWIVWPWNIAMPLLLFILFPPGKLQKPATDLLRVKWAAVVIALFTILPVFSYFGYWDSYLSFSLYTGRLTKADIFISESVKNRLPAPIQPFVAPTPKPYNTDLQGPYVVLVELWADRVLRVPPLPESRAYLAVARYLTQFAPAPSDVRMVLIPRVGPTVFFTGSDLRKEAALTLE